jgi:hypothetical protein
MSHLGLDMYPAVHLGDLSNSFTNNVLGSVILLSIYLYHIKKKPPFTFDVDLYAGEAYIRNNGTTARRVLKLSLLTFPHLLDWV